MTVLFTTMIIAGYLVGSVPFAMIIAKAHGIDLRKTGSGNIGATNLSRACGRTWGWVCFLLDAGKGFLPAFIALKICGEEDTLRLVLSLAAGMSAILGHIFPLYLKFKGGKGVATSFGVALGLWPYYTVCAAAAFIIWLIFTLTLRYISLASIAAAVSFPVIFGVITAISDNWQMTKLWPLFAVAVLIPFMVIIMHRSNIKRLRDGTEPKIGDRE